MSLPPLILASVSPRRAELLRKLQIDFRVVPSDAAELHEEHLTVRELAQANAYRKAHTVATRHPEALILGADTLVALGTRLFAKPADWGEAERMLQELQGQTHQVVTGVCLVHLRRQRWRLFAEFTDVRFRPLTRDQIIEYLRSIDPFDKAGGYAIQDQGESIVAEISGSYSNVVGLPLERLQAELVAWTRPP